jgi:hypothetical protein
LQKKYDEVRTEKEAAAIAKVQLEGLKVQLEKYVLFCQKKIKIKKGLTL